jgi:hypothetical protein
MRTFNEQILFWFWWNPMAKPSQLTQEKTPISYWHAKSKRLQVENSLYDSRHLYLLGTQTRSL